MSRLWWGFLAALETVASAWLILPLIVFMIRIALTRRDILVSNEWYFAGMFLGYTPRLIPIALLVSHSVWIVRRRILRRAISN
jgi:hypothetical protein